MVTQVEQLMARLRDAAFRKEFLEGCGETIQWAQGCYDGALAGKEYEGLKGDWQGSLEFMDGIGVDTNALDERAKSLSNPQIIAPGELWDEFEVYLADPWCSISDETYNAYLDHIEHRLLRLRKSQPFALCELTFPEGSRKEDYLRFGVLVTQASILGNVSEEEIKASAETLFKDGAQAAPQVIGRVGEFEIQFAGIQFSTTERRLRKPDADESMNGVLHIELSGRSSARAMAALVSELVPLAQSHFRSVGLLESGLNLESFKIYLPFGIKCLIMAILNTSNKDTFQRRIANAVRLLAEADNQRSDPIGLSLCMTAIDSLLGRKGQEMTYRLADFVAGLLEPDVSLRRQAAEFVGDLYDNRSRVLHGDRLEGNSQLRSDARQLAASVLYGVWSYQDFFEQWYANTPKPDEFFAKLRENLVKPGLPDGVLALPVRTLWQKNSNEGRK